MPQHQFVPHLYCLLSVFSGAPLKSLPALEAAGLRRHGDRTAISSYHLALFRQLHQTTGQLRWEPHSPTGPGYVLTARGEQARVKFAERYSPLHPPRRGPSLGEVAQRRLDSERP